MKTNLSFRNNAVGVDGYNSSVSDVVSSLGINCEMSTGRSSVMVLNDQGGSVMDISEDKTATLRSKEHGHQSVIINDNFKEQVEDFVKAANEGVKHQQDLIQSDLGIARTLAPGTHMSGPHLTKTLVTSGVYSIDQGAGKSSCNFDEDLSPTLTTAHGGEPVIYENHLKDGRVKPSKNGVSPTLCSRMGTGGNNVPLVMNEAYGISAYNSGAMISSNPHSGIYKADTSRSLDLNGGNPACNQGGIMIVQTTNDNNSHKGSRVVITEVISFASSTPKEKTVYPINTMLATRDTKDGDTTGFGVGGEGEPQFTISTQHEHAVCIGNGQAQSTKISDKVGTLNCMHDQQAVMCFAQNQRNEVRDLQNKSGALAAEPGMKQQTYVLQGSMIGRDDKNGPQGNGINIDKSFTLNTIDRHAVVSKDQSYWNGEQVTGTLTAKNADGHQHMPDKGTFNAAIEHSPHQSIVRRLTPLECERLQNFPDNWTNIGEWTDTKGKKHKAADGPRYEALGNSIALPFWQWMAGGIVEELKKDGVEEPKMASLFDGISGFPLVFSRVGCKPAWSSEIREFPIAVAKRHFPEDEECVM